MNFLWKLRRAWDAFMRWFIILPQYGVDIEADIRSVAGYPCQVCRHVLADHRKRDGKCIRCKCRHYVDEFGMVYGVKCQRCGHVLQIVRPGKYQCECEWERDLNVHN